MNSDGANLVCLFFFIYLEKLLGGEQLSFTLWLDVEKCRWI